jgi:hypothetical protein
MASEMVFPTINNEPDPMVGRASTDKDDASRLVANTSPRGCPALHADVGNDERLRGTQVRMRNRGPNDDPSCEEHAQHRPTRRRIAYLPAP